MISNHSFKRAGMIVPVIAAITLGGCASTGQDVKEVDLNQQARIRVFHGPAVQIYPGASCFSENRKHAMQAAVGGFSYLVPNKKLDMPATDDMPISYHEYAIQADEEMTVEMYSSLEGSGIRWDCGPIAASFIPEAGHDYDTYMDTRGGGCSLVVRELLPGNDGKITPKRIPVNYSSICVNRGEGWEWLWR